MLLVALAVSGCGSATHIPAPSAPGLATPQDSVLVPATTDLGDITNLVVVALTPGTSAQDLASQTGALVVRQTDTGYATMQPALGPASACDTFNIRSDFESTRGRYDPRYGTTTS